MTKRYKWLSSFSLWHAHTHEGNLNIYINEQKHQRCVAYSVQVLVPIGTCGTERYYFFLKEST